jgi:hypothetical protein
LYEYNARNQITLWGPLGEIVDYANKQWAGALTFLWLMSQVMFLLNFYVHGSHICDTAQIGHTHSMMLGTVGNGGSDTGATFRQFHYYT